MGLTPFPSPDAPEEVWRKWDRQCEGFSIVRSVLLVLGLIAFGLLVGVGIVVLYFRH